MMFVDWFDGLSVAGCGVLYVAGLFLIGWVCCFDCFVACWGLGI